MLLRENLINFLQLSGEVIWARQMSVGMTTFHDLTWRYTSGSYGQRWSLDQDFVKTYLNLDGSRHTATGEEFTTEVENRDYRLSQSIITPGYTKLVGGVSTATPPDFTVTLTGYQVIKFNIDDKAYESASVSYNSLPIMRYAEVLLNYAEAKAELGEFSDDIWNKTIKPLRERAGVDGKRPTSADPYLQQYYGLSDSDLLEIRRERAIELLLEGFRYNDLMRWHAGELLNKQWYGIYIPAMDTSYDLNGDGINDVCVISGEAGNEPGVTYIVLESQGVVGTAQYLSPEQARGESVDMRSDLYSAGCVLYEMLTGRPPFTGDSAVAIAYQHVSEVATPPSTIVPGLPKMWDSICAKAMAKDRQNRYATASEFKNDLLTFMNGGVPMAAAFNPLTDLTNMKARKQAEMDAATVPMAPATDAPTQAFNPVTGQFEAVPNPNGGVETKTRAEQRAKAAQERKKKQIIIASVVGSIVVLLAVIGIFFALNGHQNTADLVSVPDFTDTSNISQARVEEQLKTLGLKLDARDDATSSQPKGTITKQNPKGGKKVAKGSTVSIWFSTGPQAVSVPDVSGKTQEEAKGILEAAGFKIGNVMTVDSASIEKDKVVNTNPAANSKQTKGTIITLYISSGMTKIPDGLVGQAKDSVIAQLKQAGLTQITIESEYSDSVQSGAVTRIDPGSGSTVEMGTAVTIWVSTGKQQVSVPFVTNSTLAEAKSILEAAGFQVSVNGPQDDDATVVSMSPNGGSQADSGSTITLTTKKSSSDTNNTDTNNNGNTNNQQGN